MLPTIKINMDLLVSCILICLSIISCCEGSVFERRCRCVCPHELEGITDNQTVFQREVTDPNDCKCLTILSMAGVLDGDENVCLQCDCQYESRNTLVIKIVIYGLLVVIFFMSVYAFIVYPVIYVKCIRNSNYNSLEEFDESLTFEARLRRFQRRFQQRVQEQRESYR